MFVAQCLYFGIKQCSLLHILSVKVVLRKADSQYHFVAVDIGAYDKSNDSKDFKNRNNIQGFKTNNLACLNLLLYQEQMDHACQMS